MNNQIQYTHVPDPYRMQGIRSSITVILALVVAALSSEHPSVLAIAELIDHPTPQRLLAQLDPPQVATVVRQRFDPVLPCKLRNHGRQGAHSAESRLSRSTLDGEAQRGRLRHGAPPTHPVHVVCSLFHDLIGVLTQLMANTQQVVQPLTDEAFARSGGTPALPMDIPTYRTVEKGIGGLKNE